jgi:NAD(P)-dependent dehydrogenase (short-subunit alcohol dehydrogenase family)
MRVYASLPHDPGAASGLGLALTQNILARGDNVIATGRSTSQFHDLLSDTSIDQTRLRVLALDVTAPIEEIKRGIDTAVEFWGHVDVVVNNAGICAFGVTEEIGSVLIIAFLLVDFTGVTQTELL